MLQKSGDVAGQTASGSVQQAQESAEEEVEYEEKWIQYHFDQSKQADENAKIGHEVTNEGILEVKGLTYKLEPAFFTAGVYELEIKDVTRGIDIADRLDPLKIDLKIFDSVAEAEELAQQAADKKGKKK